MELFLNYPFFTFDIFYKLCNNYMFFIFGPILKKNISSYNTLF